MNSIEKLKAQADKMKSVNELRDRAIQSIRTAEAERDKLNESYNSIIRDALLIVSGCEATQRDIVEETRSIIKELNVDAETLAQ